MFNSRDGVNRVEDFAGVHLQCTDGHSVFIDVSWRYVGPQEQFGLEVVGDRGSASVAPLSVYKEMHGTPVKVTPQLTDDSQDPFSQSYRAEWEHFLGIVRGETPAPDLAEQLLLHRTMDAIQRSAREGREISL
jgi:predicted dehydrogenase